MASSQARLTAIVLLPTPQMACDKEPVLGLRAVNHLLTRRYGQLGVHVEGELPIGLAHLCRIGGDVTDYQRMLAA